MLWLLYLFFVASGFCALVYQVAWVRILSVDFGITVYAISTVLTIFMTGLALGSYLFGRMIDRGSHPLRVYGWIELVLGLYAAIFAAMIPFLHQFSAWLLQGNVLPYQFSSLLKFLIALVVLLPPTTLMGGTLPVLAKFVTESPKSIGMRLGLLYGFNTLGAVLGCLAVAYALIPVLGVAGSICLAAAINVALGVCSGLLSFVVRSDGITSVTAESRSADSDELPHDGQSMRLLHAIAFSSGFITLASEVLWTRMFINFLTGNVLIFATILAAFLVGIAAGSLFVAMWVDRLRRLDNVMGLILAINALWLIGSVLGQRAIGHLFSYVRGWDTTPEQTVDVYLCLATLFLIVAIPATAFGSVFPLLFRWSSRSLSTLGHDVGRLYATNTVGSIAGSFVSGFLLIWLLGVTGSLLLLAGAYTVLAMLVSRHIVARLFAIVVAAVFIVTVSVPTLRQPVYWFNGAFKTIIQIPSENTLFLAEGVEATVGVISHPKDPAREHDLLSLTVNGVIVAETTQRDLWDLLLKAHLPMLMHEDPKRVALVGLGAGVSLGAVGAYDVERIDCAELSPDVEPAHRFFGAVNGECWRDPRVHLWINDGRHFLLTTKHRYDVLSVDPTDPPICTQYSQDFFQICHDRLECDGIMVQWVPLFDMAPQHIRIIMRAFLNVFPETTLWYDGTSVLLIGRRGGPLKVNFDQFCRRLERPEVRENLALIGNPDARLLLCTYAFGPEALNTLIGQDVPSNTDDRPILEYSVLLAGKMGMKAMAANLAMLAPHYEPIETILSTGAISAEELASIRAKHELMRELLQVRIHDLRGETERMRNVIRRLQKKHRLDDAQLRLLAPFR